ncbi:trypsin-like peptidase domain-containing protein [Streptomyces sp. NPDC100445]|uniref:trypsin-like peptidase domain-containing protein n=1 Tax=Streptomyces sp. NPDC100445 TaxID=3366102 RepID=UPI0038120DC3
MTERGPHTAGGRRERADGPGRGAVEPGRARPAVDAHGTAPDGTRAGAEDGRAGAALVRIHDPAGRPRGLGFLVDHEGTLLTSHESVDGLPRLTLRAAGRTHVVTADAVTPLPALDLALVRTEGLGVDPLPLTTRDRIDAGTYVRLVAGCWREARVLAATPVTYPATHGVHLLDDALELAIGTAGRDALRSGGGAAGGPVLDARTGAVVGVLGTALRTDRRDEGFAVPLRPAADAALAALLARNAATVPAYGADLNLAGILQLTATSVGQDGPPGALTGHTDTVEPVERAAVVRELAAFSGGDRPVLGLVGPPGSGRTTELAALAARRARSTPPGPPAPGAEGDGPAPTVWLRGADLTEDDGCIADAAARALDRAARIVAASRGARPEDLGDLTPARLARLAARAGRPLLLLLDGPEEMPPVLAHRLPEWTRGTADWLRATGARLVVACREEYWERAGACFPTDLLHTPGGGPVSPTPAVPLPVPSGRLVPPSAAPVPASRVVASAADRAPTTAAAPAPVPCAEAVPPSAAPVPASRAVAPAAHRAPTTLPAPAPVSSGEAVPPSAAPVPVARVVAPAAHRAPTTAAAPAPVPCGEAVPPPAAPVPAGYTALPPAFPCPSAPEAPGSTVGSPPDPVSRVAPPPEIPAAHAAPPSTPPRPGAPEASLGVEGAPGAPRPAAGPPPGPVGRGVPSPAGPTVHAWPAVPPVPAGTERLVTSGHAFPSPAPPEAPVPPEAPAPGEAPLPLPPCLRLGDLRGGEARRARTRYGIAEGVLAVRDAGHPLALRLMSEVRSAVPDAPPAAPVDRHDVFAAHLDLMCLRIAVRLAAAAGLRGTAVRRLAARVAGQVHEAARRSLGPGQGELDREAFEAVFPWGPAPARLGGGIGWASAVLTEGLLVPAGRGYRFAHEELADWIQGLHLDLDEALRALVHRPGDRDEPGAVPVPHHRVGPVVQALLHLARQRGPRELTARLRELADALERSPGSWWAARLLARTLLEVPDAAPYTEMLRLLADRVVARRRAGRPVPAEFGPVFWTAVPVPGTERLELLRRLVLADPAPPAAGDRYLDAVAGLLAAAPTAVQPLLTRWFADERPLPATPHATVATAAQALLHTHRHRALDDLTEVLVDCAHRRADELLAVLAEDEPSAVCRAVDRWAHDERPARRAAAAASALRAAPHVRSEADRELLRWAALALLARPADRALHGTALALLVLDPRTRDRHLPAALRHFTDGDPEFPPDGLAPALTTHPEPVLEAFRARLRAPDADGTETVAALRCLTEVTTPSLARRVAALLAEAVRLGPGTAGHVAGHVDRRLEQGPAARPVLLPLVAGLLEDGPEAVRAALGTVLAAAGTSASRPLRRELLELLLTREEEPAVLDAVLRAAVTQDGPAGDGAGQDGDGRDGGGPEEGRRDDEVRGLVHRTGLLLARTPEGAARLDQSLADLVRYVPGFAARVARWLTDAPGEWAAVVGPGTRRVIEDLAGVHVPA